MKKLQRILRVFVGFFLIGADSAFSRVAEFDGQANTISIGSSEIGKNKNIKIGLNKVLVLRLPLPARDVLVSDPSKVDVVIHAAQVIYVFGKGIGQANVFIFENDNSKEIIKLNIQVERDIGHLEGTLRRFIPDSEINVEMVSDNVVLHGSVRNIQDSLRAVELADAFIKQGGDQAIASSNIGRFNLHGNQSKIVNLLTIQEDDQVMVHLTISEVRREVLKQIGFTSSIHQSANGSSSSNNLESLEFNFNDKALNTMTLGGALSSYAIKTMLGALEQAKAIRILAEPTVAAVSGKPAKFRVGGERLYHNVDKNGTVTMSSHEYGIMLNCTPTVLSSGRISLRIETEVSEPVQVAGEGSGEYRTRKLETTLELPSGGSMVLAGLIKDDIQQTRSGVPVLSKIPILGSLFGSKKFDREETETIIIATPYLVKAVSKNDLVRPDDNFDVESDVKSFFLNRVNKIYGRKEESEKEKQNYQGAVGFIYK
ncbi:type II and III secretion system protein family protein [Candidatus Liberibacter sp.]|uniref:type II and III secretion system protein family protein n=1 Tax=Candidatus Liberibacter sp. TaxID=34022 RepID=UPI0015F56361|nr:type II and III secretion system protein family protein [Candidatus Liberibacter sp.]MBA5723932.1 type II and III secretion system protein family protein [Candidatus Liberibacter sp.]